MAVALAMMLIPAHAEQDTAASIWEMILATATPAQTETQAPTATPAPGAFRFREGIRWGMSPKQVRALESEEMTERSLQDWSIMVTTEKVAVSRFTADLVFMFHQEKLEMITYEFQRRDAEADFSYLAGALTSLYGEKAEASADRVKILMDAIYPGRYRLDQIREPWSWTLPDGTGVYLYWYSGEAFAIMYASPEAGGGFYQTNGL